MKPEPAPNVPGNTPGERMSNALRMVLTVSTRRTAEERGAREERQPKEAGEENSMTEDKRNLECEIMAFENRQKIWRKVSCSDRIAQDAL